MEKITCLKCGEDSYTASPKQAKICPHCYGLGKEKLSQVKELSHAIRQANQLKTWTIKGKNKLN